MNVPILSHIDINKSVNPFCDASENSCDCVLTQDKNILDFYSYKFNRSEKNYSISKEELYSIVKRLKHFEYVIFGHKIRVFTDSRNTLPL